MKRCAWFTVRTLAATLCLTSIAFAQSPVATGNFDGCPAAGQGGDSSLNLQKNRSGKPSGVKNSVSVAVLQGLPTVPKGDGNMRSNWPTDLRATIENQEEYSAYFTGYIIKAKISGKEACNCDSAASRDHDVHIYLSDTSTGESVAQSAIAEVTPRWRAANPSWTAHNVQRLATSHERIRITGWLLYDQEHWNMISSGERGTLWEIHPITRIQVWYNGGWMDLAAYEHAQTS
jgi:hypothetical protein